MRFRRWPRPTPYQDTSRKHAAFLRKQRLEREALPLFAAMIGARQHGVAEEMARRAVWWDDFEREWRQQRAAWWRKARTRLFALDTTLRRTIRDLWRTCPYPADPAVFSDLLHRIAVGRLGPNRPPWIFHQAITPRTTPNPATFDEAFRPIGAKRGNGDPKTAQPDQFVFCGNLGSGLLFLTAHIGHQVDIDVRATARTPTSPLSSVWHWPPMPGPSSFAVSRRMPATSASEVGHDLLRLAHADADHGTRAAARSRLLGDQAPRSRPDTGPRPL